MDNVLQFKVKTDRNGNTKLLDINLVDKTYSYGYCYRFSNEEDVELSSKEMSKLVDKLTKLNFKRSN